MLFNSKEFIFGYLPVVLLAFYALGRVGPLWGAGWLAVASLFFYGWWNPSFLVLLVGSILFNYWCGSRIVDLVSQNLMAQARGWLRFSIATNLAALVYYKYAGFLVGSLANLFQSSIHIPSILLPLGISFFTFTQIAYLVDAYQKKASRSNLLHYVLFVTYFPHLIAGPVLHHKEMMSQFSDSKIYRFSAARFEDGTLIFLLGLAKKTILADRFGTFAAPAFNAADDGKIVTMFAAWGAALAYTFQLYFDFSGYSDMAIGLGRMTNIELPLNFDSPYKSRSIVDFWRNWHITLSRFLRDYLYIPLGGNRHGEVRRYANLWITMILGGLWHGAGWTFVVWGAYHGGLLVVNNLWRSVSGRPNSASKAPQLPGMATVWWAVTFLSVVVGWVVFRAKTFSGAMILLKGMAGVYGAALPSQLLKIAPPLRWVASGLGNVPFLADGTVMGCVELMVLLGLAFGITLAFPTVYRLSRRVQYLLVIATFALSIQRVLYSNSSEFLYFQF
jgi:D-alanyl-lipoteichoic acid acyltransferase DltB (MBOAT superfamily)